MTNQENFKKDTTELFNLIRKYKNNYDFMGNGLDDAEGHLRTALEIVRTDEENTKQRQVDCYC